MVTLVATMVTQMVTVRSTNRSHRWLRGPVCLFVCLVCLLGGGGGNSGGWVGMCTPGI